jgi:hypothetical protein
VTRRALKSILYEPFGIVVPFANVGFDSAKVLYPSTPYMVSLLTIKLRAHPNVITHIVIASEEVTLDERSDNLDIIEGSASLLMREGVEGKWVCPTVESWSELDIRLYQVQPEKRRAKCHPVDRRD